MKKHLKNMLEALIADNTEKATEELRAYLSSKTRSITLGEKEECDDDDGDKEEKDDDEEDKDSDKKSKKKGKDDDKEEVDESLAHAKSGVEDKEKQYHGYRHNHKGEVYHKVPHKDDSEGYGHEKSKKAARKLKAESDSGAHAKTPNAYTTKPHKDNSMKAKSEDKGTKGLKSAGGKNTSPDSDGKKTNRRTDKTAKYHGKSREGKPV